MGNNSKKWNIDTTRVLNIFSDYLISLNLIIFFIQTSDKFCNSQSEIYRRGNVRMVGNGWFWSIMLGNANEAENLELVMADYPRNFLHWKLNYKQRWSSSAFPSENNMFMKVVGIPAIFDDSQL